MSHGPGPRLRDGRLARSMTLEEAAELLKLDPSVLAALERDDFTALPESLYVRGYLTSYARLLGISEAEVIRDYRAFSGESTAPRLSTRRPIHEHPGSGDVGIRWFSYALMAGIVGLVGWWAYQRLPVDSIAGPGPIASIEAQSTPSQVAAAKPSAAATQLVAERPTVDPVAEPVAAPTPELPQVPPVSDSEPDLAEVAAYTAVPESVEPPVVATVDVAPQDVVPQVERVEAQKAGGVEAIHEAAESAGAADGDPGAPPAVAALDSDTGYRTTPTELRGEMPETDTASPVGGLQPSDQLELSFSRDCWVEIRDSEEQRLAYGLAKAGSTRRVEGRAPFRILVGDSGAVEIRLNGEIKARSLYDAGEGRPARFTLGGGELETAAAP